MEKINAIICKKFQGFAFGCSLIHLFTYSLIARYLRYKVSLHLHP